MIDIKNKVALITGGSKGIGYGVAQVFVAEGLKVAITCRSQVAAENAAVELNKLGKGEAYGVASDVRSLASQMEAVEKVIARK